MQYATHLNHWAFISNMKNSDSPDLTHKFKMERYNRILRAKPALIRLKLYKNIRVIKQHYIVQSVFCADDQNGK